METLASKLGAVAERIVVAEASRRRAVAKNREGAVIFNEGEAASVTVVRSKAAAREDAREAAAKARMFGRRPAPSRWYRLLLLLLFRSMTAGSWRRSSLLGWSLNRSVTPKKRPFSR